MANINSENEESETRAKRESNFLGPTDALSGTDFSPPCLSRNATVLVLGALVLFAFLTRIYGLNSLPLNYDEPLNMRFISAINFRTLRLPATSFQHPPLSIYMLWVGKALFGKTPFGFRIVNVAIGTLSVILFFFFTRSLPLKGGSAAAAGIISTCLLTTNRFHLGWSRLVNQEIIYLAFVLLTLWFFWRAYDAGKSWWPCSIAFSAAILSKELAILLVVPLGIFLLSSIKGRRILGKMKFLATLTMPALAIAFVGYIAVHHGETRNFNPSKKLALAQSVHINTEPLEFFLMPVSRHIMPKHVPGTDPIVDSWMYPSMFWLMGALLLGGVAASWILLKSESARLLRYIFLFYFLFFTFMGREGIHRGGFWWGDIFLIPAVVLTAQVLAISLRRFRYGPALVTTLLVFFFVDAVFFAAVTPEGPILSWLHLTYANLAERLPFLF